jgi:AraC-like DNA-binding protein
MRNERADYVSRGDGIDLLQATFERHVYERHMHDMYAIGVTLRGVQRFWCRGTTHDSRPGDVIVIGPGETHDGRSGAAGGYAYRMFYVRVDVFDAHVREVVGRPCGRIGPRRPLLPDPHVARQLNAAWSAVAGSAASLSADELLDHALNLLIARHMAATDVRPAGRHDHTLRRVRDYLHDSVERPVRLAELRALSSLSRFQLTRAFQARYGLPLHAYHVHLRLEEAKRRLSLGQPIAAVSTDLGFVDQSHFHRRFKGSFGMTPGQWRAAHAYKTPGSIPRDDRRREHRFGIRGRPATF